MLNIIVNGINGAMGQILEKCIDGTPDMQIAAGIDISESSHNFPVYIDVNAVAVQADVLIDFSRPEALLPLLQYADEHNIPIVLATTGYTDNDKMMIAKYAGHIPVFFSANMSLGVNLQIALAKKAAELLAGRFDIEIIEKHHNRKVDSPSGTALSIAEAINTSCGNTYELTYGRHSKTQKRETNEIGIHAVRGGTVVGEHDVLFLGNDETLEINHKALSRNIFAEGALRAAKYLQRKPAGLYSMESILEEVFSQ